MKSNDKKISVIVPVYKAEKSISKCIESILTQTYSNFELILIDDASPDDSGTICDKYSSDPRVKVFHNPDNYGVSYSRNIGLKNATGDYIAFCDSDDYYTSDHLQKSIETSLSKDSDITISGYYLKNKGKLISSVATPSRYVNITDVVIHFALNNEFLGSCWNKLFRRSIVYGITFPENLNILEDTYFLCKVMQRSKKMYYLAEPLYYYCENKDSAVHNENNLYSDHDTLKYLDSYSQILSDIKFNSRNKKIIEASMFRIAVDFKNIILNSKNAYEYKLLKNLNENIAFYKKPFFECKEIDFRIKVKYAVKLLFPKIRNIFKSS